MDTNQEQWQWISLAKKSMGANCLTWNYPLCAFSFLLSIFAIKVVRPFMRFLRKPGLQANYIYFSCCKNLIPTFLNAYRFYQRPSRFVRQICLPQECQKSKHKIRVSARISFHPNPQPHPCHPSTFACSDELCVQFCRVCVHIKHGYDWARN